MAYPTDEDYDNLRLDMQTIAAVTNGAADAPDVVSRTGTVIKTLAKVMAAIFGYQQTASSAADLAGQYANANTDADIPGAPAGARGAKWYYTLVQNISATLTAIQNSFDLTDTKVGNILFGVSSNDGGMPFAVNDDGTTDMAAARSPDAVFGKVAAPRLIVQNSTGAYGGELAYAEDVPGLQSGVAAPNGIMPFAVNEDGDADILFDPFARFSDNALVTTDVILEARHYALHRRHVYAFWKTGANAGKTFKLTTDDTADHSVNGFDPTSGYASIQKRTGHRVQRFAVNAAMNGGALASLVSNRDIFLDGDSFVQQALLTAIYNASTDKNRSYRMTGSGGSWLTSHLAALGGPRVPALVNGAATGAGGGVVPASQVGSNPGRSGGLSQTEVVGTINNGADGAGNILNVASVTRGVVAVGQQLIIPGGGLLAGNVYTVKAFGSGGTTGTGGVGTYQLTGAAVNQTSTNIYLGPWAYPGDALGQEATVIIMDGGLDDAGDGAAAIIARLLAFDKAMNAIGAKWYYVQSGIDKGTSPANVTAKLNLDAQIAAGIGWHYIETYTGMRVGGGSTVGTNGGEVWGTDYYGDTLHPSTLGQTKLSQIIMTRVEGDGN